MVFFFCPFEDISLFTETSPLNNFSIGTAHIKAYEQGGSLSCQTSCDSGFRFLWRHPYSTTPILLTFMISKGYQELFQPVGLGVFFNMELPTFQCYMCREVTTLSKTVHFYD